MKISKKKFKLLVTLFTLLAIGLVGISYFFIKNPHLNPLSRQKNKAKACFWIDPTDGLACNQASTLQGRSFYFDTDKTKLEASCANTKIAIAQERLGSGKDTKDCSEKFKSQCNGKNEKITFKSPNICICKQMINLQPCQASDIQVDNEIQCTGIEVVNENNQILTEGKGGFLKDQPVYIKMYYQKPKSNTNDYTFYLRQNGGKDIKIPQGAVKRHTDNTNDYLEITWTLSKLEVDDNGQTASLQSFALDPQNKKHTSKLCSITLSLEKKKRPTCTKIDIKPAEIDFNKNQSVKVETVALQTTNTSVTSTDKCQVIFTIQTEKQDLKLTTKNNVCKYFKTNTFIFDKDFLYNPNNFKDKKTFPILQKTTKNPVLSIKTAILINDSNLDTTHCQATIQNKTSTKKTPAKENQESEDEVDKELLKENMKENTNKCLNGCFDSGEECDPTATTQSASIKNCKADPNYDKCSVTCTLTKTKQSSSTDSNKSPSTTPQPKQNEKGSSQTTTYTIAQDIPACMANKPGYSVKEFQIKITNTGQNPGGINKVTDKLPQGLTYVTNSLKINGNHTNDDILTLTSVGTSAQMDIEPTSTWTLQPQQSLIITFSIGVTGNAQNGEKTNEVIITPTNISNNTSSLQSIKSMSIKDSCTTTPVRRHEAPKTGLFNGMLIKIVAGMLLIILGFLYYNSSSSKTVAYFYATSPIPTFLNLLYLRVTEPFKYFEKKVLYDLEKRKSKSTKRSKR